jgi:hypothetical protein
MARARRRGKRVALALAAVESPRRAATEQELEEALEASRDYPVPMGDIAGRPSELVHLPADTAARQTNP